jgi:hypothetical protein
MPSTHANALSLPSAEAVEEGRAVDLKAAQLASVQSGTIRLTAVMDESAPFCNSSKNLLRAMAMLASS